MKKFCRALQVSLRNLFVVYLLNECNLTSGLIIIYFKARMGPDHDRTNKKGRLSRYCWGLVFFVFFFFFKCDIIMKAFNITCTLVKSIHTLVGSLS